MIIESLAVDLLLPMYRLLEVVPPFFAPSTIAVAFTIFVPTKGEKCYLIANQQIKSQLFIYWKWWGNEKRYSTSVTGGPDPHLWFNCVSILGDWLVLTHSSLTIITKWMRYILNKTRLTALQSCIPFFIFLGNTYVNGYRGPSSSMTLNHILHKRLQRWAFWFKIDVEFYIQVLNVEDYITSNLLRD